MRRLQLTIRTPACPDGLHQSRRHAARHQIAVGLLCARPRIGRKPVDKRPSSAKSTVAGRRRLDQLRIGGAAGRGEREWREGLAGPRRQSPRFQQSEGAHSPSGVFVTLILTSLLRPCQAVLTGPQCKPEILSPSGPRPSAADRAGMEALLFGHWGRRHYCFAGSRPAGRPNWARLRTRQAKRLALSPGWIGQRDGRPSWDWQKPQAGAVRPAPSSWMLFLQGLLVNRGVRAAWARRGVPCSRRRQARPSREDLIAASTDDTTPANFFFFGRPAAL